MPLLKLGHRTSAILLFACVTVSAQSVDVQKGRDVFGWRGTRWGMSPQELQDLFPREIEVTKIEGFGNALEIRAHQLFGEPFHVVFNWDKGRLIKVVVAYSGEAYILETAQKILSSLEYKYGSPTVLADPTMPPYNHQQVRWTYPSTMITFSHLRWGGDEGSSLLGISYEPNEAEKL